MVSTTGDNAYEFYINNNDMQDGKPNFKTFQGRPLEAGSLAINVDTKKGYFWDEEAQDWK